MIFPIKLVSTPESYIIFNLTIPVWFKMDDGWKHKFIYRDRMIAPQLLMAKIEPTYCLHAYCFGFRFRVRSWDKVKELREKNPDTKIRWTVFTPFKGWGQVFQSAII